MEHDLVSYINTCCPKTGHQHRIASPYEMNVIKKIKRSHLLGNDSMCCLCNEDFYRGLSLGWTCKNYKDIDIKPLTLEIKKLLTEIFNNHPMYYLPDLVHEKIFNYAQIFYVDKIEKINKRTINHLFNCRLCSEKTVRWLNFNTCAKHQITRPHQKFNNKPNYLN